MVTALTWFALGNLFQIALRDGDWAWPAFCAACGMQLLLTEIRHLYARP